MDQMQKLQEYYDSIDTGFIDSETKSMKQIPYWEVDSVWPKAAPMLQKAIDTQDEWALDAVYKKLVNAYDPQPLQLWDGGTFALVTQIQAFPTGIRKCLLFLCGGSNLESIKEAQSQVEIWAKKYHGCTKMIIYGRRGWEKVLDRFKENTVILEKAL